MTVRFFPGSRRSKSSLVAGFLDRFHVEHELVRSEDVHTRTVHLGTDPALEVDGRWFVDPNEEALKKILHLD
jgi:hypothetical protein